MDIGQEVAIATGTPRSVRDPAECLNESLDTALGQLRTGKPNQAISELARQLNNHVSASPTLWLEQLVAQCRRHELAEVLLDDPYTRRAWEKPKGYAGDAAMLDFVYDQHPPAGISERGAQIFAQTTGSSNGASVRFRRQLLAGEIDDCARLVQRPSVLAVACGHLREAEIARAVADRALGRFVALDQDDDSLAVVRASYDRLGIEVATSTVAHLIREGTPGRFHFIYAAGLYDYLSNAVAIKLTSRLFEGLKSGGHLLFANFLPSNAGRGYMEAFMDWSLIYRGEEDMRAPMRRLPPTQLASAKLFMDPPGNVVYLDLRRK